MKLKKKLDNTLNSFFKLLRQNFLPLSKISITANAHFKNSDFEDKISPKEEDMFTYAIFQVNHICIIIQPVTREGNRLILQRQQLQQMLL